MKQLIYAGIGSRATPQPVLDIMRQIGIDMAKSGWLLRSGHADGADSAFELGCIMAQGKKEIFLPWDRFNKAPANHPDYRVPTITAELHDFSASYHPNWGACSNAAKLLHMRNACQILGEEGTSPVDLVICWTPNGSGSGGTGQALRIAEGMGIPVFDLGSPDESVLKDLCDLVDLLEMNQKEKIPA
jgi:hypothetical protein